MKKNNWEEAEIENLLKELPSIKDSRSKEEIYRLINRGRPVKKQKTWAYPALAGIAALLILALITPSLYNSMDSAQYENSASDMAMESADAGSAKNEITALPESGKENTEAKDSSFKDTANQENSNMLAAEAPNRTNVYKEDLQSYDVLTYGLVTPDAVTVPVSVLIEKKSNAEWLERYKSVSQVIPEQSWGFEDYYPLAGSLELIENNQLTYTVADKELNNDGGTGEQLLIDSLLTALQVTDNTTINLRTKEGKVPSFSHLGEVAEINKADNNKRGYYSYTLKNGETYLVPGETRFDTMADALKGMTASPNSLYEAVIPDHIQPVLTEEKSLLTIGFQENLLLKDSPEENDSLFIEGILLTAKEFGFEEVLFQNIENPDWKGFDFSNAISVPVSPNKKILN